jgi:hypothetical protein
MITKILVFKTDIKTKKKLQVVKPVFNRHPGIAYWSVDREDIDNVLRIEAVENVNEKEIIHLIKTCGFYCEVLTD